MLNTCGKSRHPCLVSDFRRENFNFSPLSFFQHLKNFVPLHCFGREICWSFKFAFFLYNILYKIQNVICFKILSLLVFRSLICCILIWIFLLLFLIFLDWLSFLNLIYVFWQICDILSHYFFWYLFHTVSSLSEALMIYVLDPLL